MPILFQQKITKTNCKHIKASKTILYEKIAPKMLVKLTTIGIGTIICLAVMFLMDYRTAIATYIIILLVSISSNMQLCLKARPFCKKE